MLITRLDPYNLDNTTMVLKVNPHQLNKSVLGNQNKVNKNAQCQSLIEPFTQGSLSIPSRIIHLLSAQCQVNGLNNEYTALNKTDKSTKGETDHRHTNMYNGSKDARKREEGKKE